MRFSKRLPSEFCENDFAKVVQKSQGHIDLTTTNPTHCSFNGSLDALKNVFTVEHLASYDPDPQGLYAARVAVCHYMHPYDIIPEQVLLTAGTSEAYSFLIKLFCDPGDVILIPQPSYPLLEHLAELEAVRVGYYSLIYNDQVWRLDLNSIQKQLQLGAKIIVVVEPNNPTGTICSSEQWSELCLLAKKYQAVIISDEVFRPYYKYSDWPKATADTQGVPIFILDGLSKACGLPQLKCSWIVALTAKSHLNACMERLNFIADAYLSVNAPVQQALPQLLNFAKDIQQQIRARVQTNELQLAVMLERLSHVQALPTNGGWYAILHLKNLPQNSEEQSVLQLLEQERVLVHPGYFYGFDEGAFWVMSLLLPRENFASGLSRLNTFLKRM